MPGGEITVQQGLEEVQGHLLWFVMAFMIRPLPALELMSAL